MGRIMTCGVFGTECDTFPTTVVAQGHDQTMCAGAPLCGQADKCPLIDMAASDNVKQECMYKCPCDGVGTTSCQKIVVYFGNGSLANGYNSMKICDVAMTIYDYNHHEGDDIVSD